MNRPCEGGRHYFVSPDFEGFTVRCVHCPLVIPMRDLVDSQRGLVAAREVVERVERDWYIKELES